MASRCRDGSSMIGHSLTQVLGINEGMHLSRAKVSRFFLSLFLRLFYYIQPYLMLHKNIGKLYVFAVLFLAAPSGFFIGLFANGGFYSKVSFITLSLLWFYFTLKGFLMVKSKIINLHKKFMLRSFALAFSAITLRLWKVILVYLFQPSPMDLYQIVSWLGWIPNLLLIELYIFKQKNK